MTHYKHIARIVSVDDAYAFRNKVFKMVLILTASEAQASKITIGLATYLKKVIRDFNHFVIEISCKLQDGEVKVKISMPSVAGQEFILTSFFDSVSISQGQLELVKDFSEKAYSAVVIDKIKSALCQKTKDELTRDIKQKKEELLASLKSLEETTLEKSKLENELSIARNIQQSMLPLDFSRYNKSENVQIFAYLDAAKEVGGDFYDCYFLDDDHFGIAVGDVSGKGVPAALMMAVCKTLLKSKARTDTSTAQILIHTNEEMARENPNSMFVTVFMAIINLKTGEMLYSNAGHCPTYVMKKSGVVVKLTELHGPVIAALEGMQYKQSLCTLEEGDMVFAYSDGITEAHNAKKELYSDQRLQDLLSENISINPELVVKNIVKDVNDFAGETEQFDDITALCFKFKS